MDGKARKRFRFFNVIISYQTGVVTIPLASAIMLSLEHVDPAAGHIKEYALSWLWGFGYGACPATDIE